jgi:hypothetical protein
MASFFLVIVAFICYHSWKLLTEVMLNQKSKLLLDIRPTFVDLVGAILGGF